jgi:hypothetical protein
MNRLASAVLSAATVLALAVAQRNLSASNSLDSAIKTVDRALAGVRIHASSQIAAEFLGDDKPIILQQVQTLQPSLDSLTVIRSETGNAASEMNGRKVLYLFGELANGNSKTHFTADLVGEDSDWKLARLEWSGRKLGTDRFAYQMDQKMTISVNSMTSGQTVVNGFMRLAAAGKWEQALLCWTSSQQSRPSKLAEIKQLVSMNRDRFDGFEQIVEGRTNFGFEHDSKKQVTEVRATGNMQYKGGQLKRFQMKLLAEDGILRIQELSFR